MAIGRCPRCRSIEDATVGKPWLRDGIWVEWVVVHPHTHGATMNSMCRPRGYSRAARMPKHTERRAERARLEE